MKRGWTLIETLVVLGIVVVLAGLLLPVYINSKKSGEITVCKSSLRQIGQAIAMYRTEYDGQGVLGKASAMGLPLFPISSTLPAVLPLSQQCRGHAKPPRMSPQGFHYRYVVGTDDRVGMETWSGYVQKFGESAIIVMDLNHNRDSSIVERPAEQKLALGVALDTSVRQVRRAGQPFDMSAFWHTEP